MKDEKALRDLHMNSHSALVNDQPSTMGVEEGAAGELSATLRTLQLLPEIRIDTSRLENLLSSFQRRLGVLEKAFSTLSGSTAEAVQKQELLHLIIHLCLLGRLRINLASHPEHLLRRKSYDPNCHMEMVEALWSAVKWMEDRMQAIDVQRNGELQHACRVAAQNAAQVEAAKVERDRIRLALEDMPSRSDLDAISDLHERRLRVLEAEQRQFTMDSCSCIKENVHAKIDQLYEDTSGMKTRLEEAMQDVDGRVGALESELEEDARREYNSGGETEESDESEDEESESSEEQEDDIVLTPEPLETLTKPVSICRGRPSVVIDRVRSMRESFSQRVDGTLTETRNRMELALSEAVASVRGELGVLALRVEEGELQRDDFIREMDDRVCENGQEVQVALCKHKQELIEEVEAVKASVAEMKTSQERAVTRQQVEEAIRESDPVCDVETKTSVLEDSLSALTTAVRKVDEKVSDVELTSSRDMKEAERRLSSRIQAVTNDQGKAHEELKKMVLVIRARKADEDTVKEVHDELSHRLRTLEDSIIARNKEIRAALKLEVEKLVAMVSETEAIAEGVRTDLSPEISELHRFIESVEASMKETLGAQHRVLETQNTKVMAFSEDLSQACASLRSEVLEALMCLVSSSRRGNIDGCGGDNKARRVTFAEVGSVVLEQQLQREESLRRVERANIGLTLLVKKMEHSVQVLSNREMFWEATDTKLKAHSEAFGEASCKAESASEQQDRFILPMDLQQYVAGNSQRVAKLLSQQADFEVLQKLTASPNVERGDLDWDRRVQAFRGKLLERFVMDTRRALENKYPLGSAFSKQNRERFFHKLEQGLKVAMSKHRCVDVGTTLFGKVKLDPVCIACDRPFGPAAKAMPGDSRAAVLDPPSTPARDPRSPGRTTRLLNSARDGKIFVPEPFLDPAVGSSATAGHHSNTNGNACTSNDQKPATKFVYRCGFKLPRDLTPIPNMDSLEVTSPPPWIVDSLGYPPGVNAMGVIGGSTTPGREREAGEYGGCGVAVREKETSWRRQHKGAMGAPRIRSVSAARDRMGAGELGRATGAPEDVTARMPRPRTAGATVGPRD